MLGLSHCSTDPLGFDPGHFTASVFLLSPDLQKVLLIHHAAFGLWIQPGGHLEPDDSSMLEAGLRELREECSVVRSHEIAWIPMILDLDIHQVPPNDRKGHPAHLHFDVRFARRAVDWDCSATSEVRAAQWVSLAAVASIDTDDSVRRALRRIAHHRQRAG